MLLDRSDVFIRTLPRLGFFWLWHRGRADPRPAWRPRQGANNRFGRQRRPDGEVQAWRFYRDFDPALASIRNEPEFKAVFADIERDMARQRAALAARPKDAPLELSAITH